MLNTIICNTSEQTLFSKFDNLNLKSIVVKLTHPKDIHKWSREKAESAVSQYKKFLFLNALYPEQELVPTAEVDSVWHVHILDTEKYRNDCEYLFGRFLDHYPYSGLKGEQDWEDHLSKFKYSQFLFQKIFNSDVEPNTNSLSQAPAYSLSPAYSSSMSSASFSSEGHAYSSSIYSK